MFKKTTAAKTAEEAAVAVAAVAAVSRLLFRCLHSAVLCGFSIGRVSAKKGTTRAAPVLRLLVIENRKLQRV